VNLEITPEPDENERAAIAAALEAEKAENGRAAPSRWFERVAPADNTHDEPHP